MSGSYQKRAGSFEQDLLWSILDQDAVPQIFDMARTNWNVDAASAWTALLEQAQLGRLRAYRGTGPFVPVDLNQLSVGDVAQDHALFVEPTEATGQWLGPDKEGTTIAAE